MLTAPVGRTSENPVKEFVAPKNLNHTNGFFFMKGNVKKDG